MFGRAITQHCLSAGSASDHGGKDTHGPCNKT